MDWTPVIFVNMKSAKQAKVFLNAFLREFDGSFDAYCDRTSFEDYLPDLEEFRENGGRLELVGVGGLDSALPQDLLFRALYKSAQAVPDSDFFAATYASGDLKWEFDFEYADGVIKRTEKDTSDYPYVEYCPHDGDEHHWNEETETETEYQFPEPIYLWDWVAEGAKTVCPVCGRPPFEDYTYIETETPVAPLSEPISDNLDAVFEELVALNMATGRVLEESKICGCTGCLKIFDVSQVLQFSYGAKCPYCKSNTVLGDASGFPITEEFLKRVQGCKKAKDSFEYSYVPRYEIELENTGIGFRPQCIEAIYNGFRYCDVSFRLSEDEQRIVAYACDVEIGDISADSWLKAFAGNHRPPVAKISEITLSTDKNCPHVVSVDVNLNMACGDAKLIYGWDRIPEDIYDNVNE